VVRLCEASQECRKRIRIRRDEAANLDRAMTKDAGFHTKTFTRVRVFNPQQILGEQLTELSMYPRQVLDTRDRGVEILPSVNELLHVDVRDSLSLKVPLLRIGRVVISKRAIDVARVSVVPLDEIRVITVHRTNKAADACLNGVRHTPTQSAGLLDEVERAVLELSLAHSRQHGLHQSR